MMELLFCYYFDLYFQDKNFMGSVNLCPNNLKMELNHKLCLEKIRFY